MARKKFNKNQRERKRVEKINLAITDIKVHKETGLPVTPTFKGPQQFFPTIADDRTARLKAKFLVLFGDDEL